MALLIAVLAFVFVIGLCIGSFLNVVILRALSEESIVFPASKCPNCQTPLKWWHNIPVISYICLGGKCAFCKKKISIQYPIIELLTAIIFTLLFIRYNFSISTLFMWAIAGILLVIAGTDAKEKVVFDVHNYIFIGLGLTYAIYLSIANGSLGYIISSVISMIICAVVIELFARVGYLFVGTRAFGEGDTYIAAGIGALFGAMYSWPLTLLILVLSAIIQVIIFLPFFIKGLVQNKDWKTLVSFVLFGVYAISFSFINFAGVMQVIGALLLAVLGVVTCIFILKGLREKPEQRTYLPFGPAMIAAALLVLCI